MERLCPNHLLPRGRGPHCARHSPGLRRRCRELLSPRSWWIHIARPSGGTTQVWVPPGSPSFRSRTGCSCPWWWACVPRPWSWFSKPCLLVCFWGFHAKTAFKPVRPPLLPNSCLFPAYLLPWGWDTLRPGPTDSPVLKLCPARGVLHLLPTTRPLTKAALTWFPQAHALLLSPLLDLRGSPSAPSLACV